MAHPNSEIPQDRRRAGGSRAARSCWARSPCWLWAAPMRQSSLPHATFTSPAQAEAPAATVAQGPVGFAGIVSKVKGAVVSIKVKVNETADASSGEPGDVPPQITPGIPLYRFFKRFGGETPFEFHDAKPHVTQAQGSGFFISADGYIVTNNHVVDNAKRRAGHDGRRQDHPAKVVGTDKKTDLALLKVNDGDDYPLCRVSPSSRRGSAIG